MGRATGWPGLDQREAPAAEDRGIVAVQPRPPPRYFQQRIDGLPVAAICLAAAGGTELLGVARQLLGAPWCGLHRASDQFRYCGSLGPLALSPREHAQFIQLGQSLAAAFPLVGLVGVDAIPTQTASGQSRSIRAYTASVEVLEQALGIEAIRLHLAACGQSPVASGKQLGKEQLCGKAILFTRRDVAIPAALVDWCHICNRDQLWPAVADISEAGTQIPRGQPIITLLASGANEHAVLDALRHLAAEAESRLAVA